MTGTAIQTARHGAAAFDHEVQRVAHQWRYPQRGPNNAPVLVLCDAPSIEAARQSLPMDLELHEMWARMAMPQGFVQGDFYFVGLCPPIPKSTGGSKKKEWEFVSQYVPGIRKIIEQINPRLVIAAGGLSLRALAGKALAVTKSRGTFHDFSDRPVKDENGEIIAEGVKAPVFPMLSPKLVNIQPDYRPIMEADLGTLRRVKEAGWDLSGLTVPDVNYEWCFDLQHLVDNPPPLMAVDTETTGLNTLEEDFQCITVQISTRPGHSYVCRVAADYFPDHPLFKDQSEADIARLREQIKALIENADVKKVFQGGKYDFKVFRSMGIEVCGWDWDTELMARFVNENFMSYSLDELVRVYVPDMAGYADHFNQTVDKGNMMACPPEKMLPYAGGDTDANLRLAKALKPLLTADSQNLYVMRKVHQRGLVAFTKTVETHGFTLDRTALLDFREELRQWMEAEKIALVRMVPAAVRRKYLSDPKGFKFSRPECVRDTLFGTYDAQGQFHKGKGFGLKPQVFTPSTANDPNMANRLASTSTKDHLPYFVNEKGPAGAFILRYIELAKAQKMYDTYAVGFEDVLKDIPVPGAGNRDLKKIVPQYNFKTNTKRTQSVDPNGQNFPKRGRFAKPFRRLIVAPPGKMLIASDLSQAELRIAAWMAQEREMLRIYREDGDIHLETAAMVMSMTLEEMVAKGKDFYKPLRQNAKATNFGYIYGAFPRTYMQVAKTQYGVDVTLREAEMIREKYFERYADLLPWHEATKEFCRVNGFVRSLHGLTRHLPSIWSPDWSVQSGAERNAVNSPVQNFGSDLGVMALTRLAAQADPDLIRPVGFIHDQLIAEVDEAHYVEGMGWLQWVMENPPLEELFGIRAPLPIKSDPEWGRNLADSTELGDADEGMQARVAEHNRKPDWWDDDEEAVWDRYMRQNDVPGYALRNVTGAMRRHPVAQFL